MAYNKYTWVDGELITAEKLNHMEDGIAEGGEAGYECTETTEQLFSETVTTAESEDGCFAELAYSEPITADELTVIFNGTQYICSKIEGEDTVYYGGIDPNTTMPDFTNYPFGIIGEVGVNFIVTESPMTATVSVSVPSIDVETTECFERAVKSASGGVLVVNANEDSSTNSLVLDKTWAEIQKAMVSRGVVVRRALLGSDEIYTPVTVGVIAGVYKVVTLDNPDFVFTTPFIDGYPKYGDDSSPT